MTTSGSAAATSAHVIQCEWAPSLPSTSWPPASRTISGTQLPAAIGGSSHSIMAVAGPTVMHSAIASHRRLRPVTTSCASRSRPVASPTVRMSRNMSSSVVGDSGITCVATPLFLMASTTSSAEIAHTAQVACVSTRSGASAARRSMSKAKSGPRACSTCSWMPLLESVGSIRGAVSAGKACTASGSSHSCDRPTRWSARPKAATISVAAGNNETIRGERADMAVGKWGGYAGRWLPERRRSLANSPGFRDQNVRCRDHDRYDRLPKMAPTGFFWGAGTT